MSEDDTSKPKYHVLAVEKITAPEGLPGNNWYHYVIGYGNSKIDGKKPGTLEAVTEYAKNVAEDLNARTGIGGGSTYASRRTGKAGSANTANKKS